MTSARTIGIAGTAKNTGKTTALNGLLHVAHRHGVAVGVTSIGYDGESIDNVTGLPKPRIILERGTIATTSESCIPPTGWEVVERTGMRTALGEVLIVRCLDTGPLVLAGPNKRLDLTEILKRMSAYGLSLIFIDGALNRLAPMSVADGLILATGAARTPDLPALAKETAAIEALFAIPRTGEAHSGRDTILRSSFPEAEDVLQLLGQNRHRSRRVVCLRPIAPGVLLTLAQMPTEDRRLEEIVLRDPVTCLLAAQPTDMAEAIGRCREAGIRIRVGTRLPLFAVTVNPFLPRPEGHQYVADAVSAEALAAIMRDAVHVPVVDIVQDGPESLWQEVRSGR